jgi:hypothetical protein
MINKTSFFILDFIAVNPGLVARLLAVSYAQLALACEQVEPYVTHDFLSGGSPSMFPGDRVGSVLVAVVNLLHASRWAAAA